MGAPTGNQFWKARAKHGRDKIFSSPEALRESCTEYFQWVVDNPLLEDNLSFFQGSPSHDDVKKMRAMTVKGLCLFLGVNSKYFNDFSDSLPEGEKDFSEVLTWVRDVIDTQKFEGAAAGLLNPGIIARDLGLADKQDVTHKVKDDGTNEW